MARIRIEGKAVVDPVLKIDTGYDHLYFCGETGETETLPFFS